MPSPLTTGQVVLLKNKENKYCINIERRMDETVYAVRQAERERENKNKNVLTGLNRAHTDT